MAAWGVVPVQQDRSSRPGDACGRREGRLPPADHARHPPLRLLRVIGRFCVRVLPGRESAGALCAEGTGPVSPARSTRPASSATLQGKAAVDAGPEPGPGCNREELAPTAEHSCSRTVPSLGSGRWPSPPAIADRGTPAGWCLRAPLPVNSSAAEVRGRPGRAIQGGVGSGMYAGATSHRVHTRSGIEPAKAGWSAGREGGWRAAGHRLTAPLSLMAAPGDLEARWDRP